jgi:hypothetical protein
MKTLTKEFGVLGAQFQNGVWSLLDFTAGYEVPFPAQPFFIARNYFDLSGYVSEHKTLFFSGATVQSPFAPIDFNGAAGDSLIIADIMSNKPLTDNEATFCLSYGNLAGPNGLTFDQTIYMRLRQYTVDLDTAAWGSMILVNDSQMGSLEATASDRVYNTRVISLGTPFTGDRVDVAGARYILQAELKEEPEYEYLMRLKRSYELQQRADRD